MVAPEDPRFHPTDRWHRETALPDWGARVIDEIRRHLEAAGLVVQVQSMETVGNILTVLYRHSAIGGHGGVYGLRRQLDYPPPVGEPSGDLAAWLGAWIAQFELIEPPGRLVAPPDAAGISWREVPTEPV
jgi:hypothetical protein